MGFESTVQALDCKSFAIAEQLAEFNEFIKTISESNEGELEPIPEGIYYLSMKIIPGEWAPHPTFLSSSKYQSLSLQADITVQNRNIAGQSKSVGHKFRHWFQIANSKDLALDHCQRPLRNGDRLLAKIIRQQPTEILRPLAESRPKPTYDTVGRLGIDYAELDNLKFVGAVGIKFMMNGNRRNVLEDVPVRKAV
jgi:hypothetical protein